MENATITNNNIETENLVFKDVLEEKALFGLSSSSSSNDHTTLENYSFLNLHVNILTCVFTIAIFIFIACFTILHARKESEIMLYFLCIFFGSMCGSLIAIIHIIYKLEKGGFTYEQINKLFFNN